MVVCASGKSSHCNILEYLYINCKYVTVSSVVLIAYDLIELQLTLFII